MPRKTKLDENQINELYLDYCANMTYKELTDKYNVSNSYLVKLINREGWVEKRKQTKELALKNVQTTFIGASEELIDRYFKAGYKLLCLWEQSVQNDPASLLDKQGKFSQFKLAQAVNNIVAIKTFLDDCTGVMNYKDAMELKLKYEQIELKKAIAGLGGDEAVQDNFIEILQQSFAKLQEEGEDDNNGSNVKE